MPPSPPPPRTALSWLAAAALLTGGAGCILDLSGLDDGASAGSGGGGASSGAAGSPCGALECGACEGACPEGVCPPSILASGPGEVESPRGLAVTGGALYWVNHAERGAVMRLRAAGGAPESLAPADRPSAVAATSDVVAWTERSGVWSCSPDDCEGTRKQLADSTAPGSAGEIATDGELLFWTDAGSGQAASDGRVMRCALADCAPEAVAELQMAPAGLALLDDAVLWTYQADGFPSGHVFRVAKLGMGSEDLAAGLVMPTGIAASEVDVYFTQLTADGRVWRCPHSEGFCDAPVDVAPAAGPLPHPRDVAVAGGRVYFTSASPGEIRSCPTPGCADGEAPRSHAAGRQGLSRMIAGPTCLFFTEDGTEGAVLKVAR